MVGGSGVVCFGDGVGCVVICEMTFASWDFDTQFTTGTRFTRNTTMDAIRLSTCILRINSVDLGLYCVGGMELSLARS